MPTANFVEDTFTPGGLESVEVLAAMSYAVVRVLAAVQPQGLVLESCTSDKCPPIHLGVRGT